MLQSVHFLEGNRPQGARGLYIWEPRLPDLMRAKKERKNRSERKTCRDKCRNLCKNKTSH
jgi:hypothetical protein